MNDRFTKDHLFVVLIMITFPVDKGIMSDHGTTLYPNILSYKFNIASCCVPNTSTDRLITIRSDTVSLARDQGWIIHAK